MFKGCSSLDSLNLSSFDTAAVTVMEYMFDGCSDLTTLDVGTFNTEKVTSMQYMFRNCSSLAELDVSGFNTATVGTIASMFEGCGNLTTLDISKFNTVAATNMKDMFKNSSNLTTLTLPDPFGSDKVTDMSGMFSGCSLLAALDATKLYTPKVQRMVNMFMGCISLTNLDLSGLNTASNVSSMLEGCSLGLNTNYYKKAMGGTVYLYGKSSKDDFPVGQTDLKGAELNVFYKPYTVQTEVGEHGSLSVSKMDATDAQDYFTKTASFYLADAPQYDPDASYAQTGKTVTVTPTGHSGYMLDTISAEDSSGLDVPLTQKNGGVYTFTMPKSDVTITVTFKDSQVLFDARNGAALNPGTIDSSGSLTLPANPEWTGYTFAGWYTGTDGQGTGVGSFGDSYSGAVAGTLYAKWTRSGKTVYTQPIDLTGAPSVTSGEGWSWDSGTLTLSGATIDCTGTSTDGGGVFGIKLPDGATVTLTEHTTNVVKAGSTTGSDSYGIQGGTGLAINGKGGLDAVGGTAGTGVSCGIYLSGGSINMQDATVSAAGGEAPDSYGVKGDGGSLTMTGGTLTASGKTAAVLSTVTAEGALVTGAQEPFISGTTASLTQSGSEPVVLCFEPSITVGEQVGAATYGTTAVLAFPVANSHFSTPAFAPSIIWTSGGAPAGVTTAFSADKGTLTVSTTAATPAGEYPFKVTSPKAGGGDCKSAEAILKVEKLEAIIVWGETSFPYSGAEQSPTATVGNKISGDNVTVTVTGGQTAVGDHYIATASSLGGTAAESYAMPFPAPTQEFTITKPVYIITFDANGGMVDPATGSIGADGTLAELPTPTRSGSYRFDGWFTAATGGTAVTESTVFTLNTTIYAHWTYIGGSTGGGSTTPTNPVAPGSVDGKPVNLGKLETTGDTTTVIIDSVALDKNLSDAKDASTVSVPISSTKDSAAAQLVVETVEKMAAKDMTLEVKSGKISYTLPTAAIDTGDMLAQLGAEDASKVPFTVTITNEKNVTVEDATLVVPPVSFTVTATYNGKTVTVDSFGGLVARTVEITKEQAGKITTAVVVENGKIIRHVPTFVYEQNGRYYAKINSMTNSTYAIIVNESAFIDTAGKWYEAVADELSARKIAKDIYTTAFEGDRDITRAEFAALIVNALGLPQSASAGYRDVAADMWYSKFVATASEYGIVKGVGDNQFAPNATITRQEAMVMIHRAAIVIAYPGGGMDTGVFADRNQVGAWAAESVSFSLANGLIIGRSNGTIDPKGNITRGETAAVILRLLQRAELVDVRADA